MKRQLAVGMAILAVALTACGRTPVVQPGLPAVTLAQSAAILTGPARTATLRITHGEEIVVEPAPVPGHNYPVRLRYDLAGTKGGAPVRIVITTFNPGGNLFMPRSEAVEVNGKVITDLNALKQLRQDLTTAEVALDARYAVEQAKMFVLPWHVASGQV